MKTDGSISPSSSSSNGAKSSLALARLCRKLSPRKGHNNLQRSLISTDQCSTGTSSPTAAPTSQLQQVFHYFDENGDGKISPAELQSCVRMVGGQLSDDEAEAAVSSSDMDGDGLLNFQDFQTLMEGSTSEEEKADELRLAFRMYENKPGSGRITPSSLKRMLSRLGQFSSIDDCKDMIRTFDLNGDGVLSFEEFAVMMR